MSKQCLFDWKHWQSGIYPNLEHHSEIKLDIIYDYCVDYIQILNKGSMGSTRFKITIVDGFAGGGRYADNQFGSPFRLLAALKEAEIRLNSNSRTVKLEIEAHLYFIEDDRDAHQCLRSELSNSEYAHQVGKTIHLIHGKFHDHYQRIISEIKGRHPKGGGRSIWILDQCGYSAVPPSLVANISQALNHKAEFVINFAVQWFNDLLADTEEFRKVYRGMELEKHVCFEDLLQFKKNSGVDWRYLIESRLGPAFCKASGAPYFTPFYIRPESNHRGYWLLHLASHEAARYAMTKVHWDHANASIHYGRKGLNMLAFHPNDIGANYLTGMSFDAATRSGVKSTLAHDLAEEIHQNFADGVDLTTLMKSKCSSGSKASDKANFPGDGWM